MLEYSPQYVPNTNKALPNTNKDVPNMLQK